MFDTVLVADSGVTALRVVRTCGRLGVQAVAVHADDDARAPHVREADEAVPLGGAASARTYGDGRKLLEAARRSGAEAVHPGAGPLALDPSFAAAVADAGLVWLGPPPALLAPSAEAAGATTRLTVVVARRDGAVDVLGLRARLGSAVDEEPAPVLSAGARDEAAAAASGVAQQVDADGVWAVEVALAAQGARLLGAVPLVTPGGAATAAVAGVDLVELQLRLAAGEPPPAPSGERAGAALSFHLRAAERFAGRFRRMRVPGGQGVRSEAGVAERGRITAEAGRLVAVVTAAGADRAQALARAREALGDVEVSGVPTNLALLRAVVDDPSFVAGEPDAALLERTSRT